MRRDDSAVRLVFVTLTGMGSPDNPSANWGSRDMADARAEALDVVLDALQWRLADARWQEIERVLAAMAAALDAGDPGALAAATADLELAGPLRLIRIGAPPVVSPAPPIRDRLNQLVYSLGGVTPGQQPGHDGGMDGDGASGS